MKILAAIDGSFQSEAAIDALGSFKWAGGTEIILFTVLKAPEWVYPLVAKAVTSRLL